MQVFDMRGRYAGLLSEVVMISGAKIAEIEQLLGGEKIPFDSGSLNCSRNADGPSPVTMEGPSLVDALE